MYKIIITTLALYLFCEILCHGFALFVRKILQNTNKLHMNSSEHHQFIQQFFYRTMLLLSIALMSHFYTEMTFFEQNNWLRFTWSIAFISLIVFILWWLNALIIRQVILKQSQQHSVSQVFKQKIGYIMRHPFEFRYLYINPDYLKRSLWMNRFLSVVALFIAFIDTLLLFNIVHSYLIKP